MRLLHTTRFLLKEFFDSQIPEYAILSHVWTEEEVSLQELQDMLKLSCAAGNEVSAQDLWGSTEDWSADFAKIIQCCRHAAKRGFEWVWIDTCCIDKKSSAELSEAINSMLRWYGKAVECYAYLADVLLNNSESKDDKGPFMEFPNSKWFTPGWTLQELLAPDNMFFLDRRWEVIGTKSYLAAEISAATGIEARYLRYWSKACVAVKMSWASRRKTSRVEDVAYCLLSLFDVNMPLLYGEGKKAFLRLQQEIIKQSDDESIFAWASGNFNPAIFASEPGCFESSGDILINGLFDEPRAPYSMTNRGLQFHVPCEGLPKNSDLILKDPWHSGDIMILSLNCSKKSKVSNSSVIGIELLKVGRTWYRTKPGKFAVGREVMSCSSTGTEGYTTAIVYISADGLWFDD